MTMRYGFLAPAFALAAALGGCASSPESVGSVFIAPGKYVLYSCPELVQRQSEIVVRQRELEGLMAKANKDAGGRLVSLMAYDTEYASAKADLKVLRQEAVEKQCQLPDPNALPPAPAAPPTVKPPAAKPKR